MKRKIALKSIGALALVLALSTNIALAGKGNADNPGVLPPQSHPYGKSYSEWGAAWWQWAYSLPYSCNPVNDTDGTLAALGQSGPVWFLAGTFGGSAERSVTVPPGKALFFPIINQNWVNLPELGDNPWSDAQLEFARNYIAPLIDAARNLTCYIDGVEVLNLTGYRCQTPDDAEFYVAFPTADNPYGSMGLPAGIYGPCIDDGIYLMLAPLSVGKHTIHFTAEATALDGSLFSLAVTYYLTVGR